jgi:peroxiredoxin
VIALRSSTLLAATAVLAILLQGCASTGVRAAKPDGDRKPAPDFTLKDADGKAVRLSDFKGKVVLLDFWETTCGPCRVEIPWFIDLQRQDKDKGLVVLGVAMDEEGWEAVKPFVAELKINYRIVIGDEATAQKYGGVDALPTTLLIDREGRIASTHVGLTAKKIFEDGIDELLRQHAGIPAVTPHPLTFAWLDPRFLAARMPL